MLACDCNPVGSMSYQCDDKFGGQCQCKMNTMGRQCDKCVPQTYDFSPEGCTECDCNSVGSRDNNCDVITGECSCIPNVYGMLCDQCLPGFWNFPNCEKCQCNGHSNTCDLVTGECQDCQNFTTGNNCDRCIDGFYSNPDSEIGCLPCRCPGAQEFGESNAYGCTLDPESNDTICHCIEGYTGPKCDACAEGYYKSNETNTHPQQCMRKTRVEREASSDNRKYM